MAQARPSHFVEVSLRHRNKMAAAGIGNAQFRAGNYQALGLTAPGQHERDRNVPLSRHTLRRDLQTFRRQVEDSKANTLCLLVKA